MKKFFSLICIACLFTLASGCGVSEKDYQEVVSERDVIKKKLVEAQKENEILNESILEIYKERETLTAQIEELKSKTVVSASPIRPESPPPQVASRDTRPLETTPRDTRPVRDVRPVRAPSRNVEPVAVDGDFYLVRPNDTLSKIATVTGVSQSRIMRLNGLSDGDMIYAGKRIRIRGDVADMPPPPQPRFEPPVQVGRPDEAEITPEPEPAPMVILPPGSNPPPITTRPNAVGSTRAQPLGQGGGRILFAYVRPGETLYQISARTGVPAESLMRLNNLSDRSPLTVGQRLRLQ